MKDNKRGSFSPEVMKLYREVKTTEDRDERGELLLQMAHRFADSYDASDDFLHEVFHSVVDVYHRDYLAYNQSGLRLGRVLMKAIEEASPTDAVEESEPVVLKTSITN
jgi:hypothetical protein